MKLGIDYGTTTTLVSFTRKAGRGSVSRLIDIGGNRSGYLRSSVPSVISVDKHGDVSIGYEAEKRARKGPKEVVLLRSLKRCLGCTRRKGGSKKNCWNPGNLQFCKGSQHFELFGKNVPVQKLVHRFIRDILELPAVREANQKQSVGTIGITVPALFGSRPRYTVYGLMLDTVNNAASIDVINEPTAAIIACQKEMLRDKDGIYAIVDIGGGTTDIVVYEKRSDNYFLFKPRGIRIAGDDLDYALLNWFPKSKGNLKSDISAALLEVRRAKERLTESKKVTLFGRTITRTDLETTVEPILSKIVNELIKEIKVVFDAYKPYSQTGQKFKMRRIYLSGGGARIPCFKTLISKNERIRALGAEVDYVRNKQLQNIFEEDLSIVVVALGASMPKSGISDSIQQMLPYSIVVKIKDVEEEKVPIYQELPFEFRIHNPEKSEIEMLAVDALAKKRKIAFDLTDELYSDTVDEIPLTDFLERARHFHVKIDKYNFMRITASLPKRDNRPYRLPWQGGIESALFDKYRDKWRRKMGYN